MFYPTEKMLIILISLSTLTMTVCSHNNIGDIDKIIQKKKVLQLYWKQRTKESEFLMEVPLKSIDIIRLYQPAPDSMRVLHGFGTDKRWIYIWRGNHWERCDKWGYFQTITLDGFKTPDEFYEWFNSRYGEKIKRMNFMRIRW